MNAIHTGECAHCGCYVYQTCEKMHHGPPVTPCPAMEWTSLRRWPSPPPQSDGSRKRRDMGPATMQVLLRQWLDAVSLAAREALAAGEADGG